MLFESQISLSKFVLLELTNLYENSQDEIISAGGQVEPPGMHMIYLPYSEDIRNTEEARDIVGFVL